MPGPAPRPPTAPTTPNYQQDYWAPDRAAVLASQGQADTSGKTWNGTTWVASGVTPPSWAQPGTTWGPQTGTQSGASGPTSTSSGPRPFSTDGTPVVPGQSLPGTPGAPSNGPGIPSGYVPRDPATGLPLNTGANTGNGAPVSSADWTKFTADLGIGSDTNPAAINTLTGRLQGAGYQVLPGPRDAQGRQDSLIINGILTRVFDSNGKWTPTSDVNGNAWSGEGGSGGGQSGSSSSFGSSGLANSGQYDQLYNILMGRAQQGLNINSKDPIIANQVNAFRAEQERGLRNQINSDAERQGPMANLAGEKRYGAEQAAQATGGLQSQLMSNELSARRTEIQNALTQMGGMLTQEQELQLRHELGLIDANLRQQGISNQNNQFLDNLGMNYWDRSQYYNNQLMGY